MTEKKDKKKNADRKASSKKETKTKGKPPNKKEKAKIKDMAQLEEQIASEKDRVLRLSAEFENYKKRKQRELDDFKRFANETIFRQLLTVADNLERAIFATQNTSDEDALDQKTSTHEGLIKGVELTYKEIMKLFETFNVKTVEAENQIFDPNFHQAVTQEETSEVPDNTVIKVLQKGYLLHDRLIRPAMVVVSKNIKEKEKNKE